MSGPAFTKHGEVEHYTWIPGAPAFPAPKTPRKEFNQNLEIVSLRGRLRMMEYHAETARKYMQDALTKLREAEEMTDIARAYQHELNIRLLEEQNYPGAAAVLKRNTP